MWEGAGPTMAEGEEEAAAAAAPNATREFQKLWPQCCLNHQLQKGGDPRFIEPGRYTTLCDRREGKLKRKYEKWRALITPCSGLSLIPSSSFSFGGGGSRHSPRGFPPKGLFGSQSHELLYFHYS